MTNFDIQGESNVLSEKQIKFICEVLEKHGFVRSKVTIATLGNAGDNYTSNVKTITAEGENGKILKMVAKVAPAVEILRGAMNTETLFGNEFVMYNKVLPKLHQLEIEADIPEEDRFNFPTCYGILEEPLHEIILLEDLRESDYVMKDRFKSLTNEDVRIIINSFAKLHSLSFALKKKDPVAYKEFASKLIDLFISPQMEENMKNSISLMEENICSLFDTDRYKEKIRIGITNLVNEAHRIRRCDGESKYSVIIHGDSWTNNILFKLNNNSGDSEECMLIDYQLSTERCPVSDLLYLMFCCTDFDTRTMYYDDWIDEYHDKLDKYLSHYGLKANYVYSKEKMLADLKRYSKFFLGWSIMISNVSCMDNEGAAKFKDVMATTENVDEIMDKIKAEELDNKTQILLKTKVQGIIDSYYNLGYCS